MIHTERNNLRTLAKALAAFAFVVLAVFGSTSKANAQDAESTRTSDQYGAIAYSKSTGRFGSSWNQATRNTAERSATSTCGRQDCRVLLWFQNGCGALAVARNGGHAWNLGRSLYEAKLLTSNRCTSQFGGCKLICSVCSQGNVP